MNNVIELTQVKKRYGQHQVLKGLNLQVPAQSVFAFLGNNGAGKSTTIRMLTGLLDADCGQVHVLGLDIRHQRQQILRQIGALVESPALYPNLTGEECLTIACALKQVNRRDIDRVLDIVGLSFAKRRKIAHFSLGMKQRLAIAISLVGSPRLLILDEPTNGLDPQGMQDIRQLIKSLPEQQACTVFVSSHLLDEVEKMATHVALLHDGQVIAQQQLATFAQSHHRCLQLKCQPVKPALDLVRNLGLQVAVDPNGLSVTGIEEQNLSPLLQHLLSQHVRILEARWHQPTLEDWFSVQQARAVEVTHAMA